MSLIKEVYFSLYRGTVDLPLKVLNRGQWTLANRVEVQAQIIGKSHRITTHWDDSGFTELIAYPFESEMQPADSFQLEIGREYCKEYRSGSLQYRVTIEGLSRGFATLEDYLESVSATPTAGLLIHRFGQDDAFTGVAMEPEANRFYTVHTYPEDGASIVSRTEIDFQV